MGIRYSKSNTTPEELEARDRQSLLPIEATLRFLVFAPFQARWFVVWDCLQTFPTRLIAA